MDYVRTPTSLRVGQFSCPLLSSSQVPWRSPARNTLSRAPSLQNRRDQTGLAFVAAGGLYAWLARWLASPRLKAQMRQRLIQRRAARVPSASTIPEYHRHEPWQRKRIWQGVEMRLQKGRGRTLHTKVALEPGDLVFVEEALIASAPGANRVLYAEMERAVAKVRKSHRILWRRCGNIDTRFYFAGLLAALKLKGTEWTTFSEKYVADDRLDSRVEQLLQAALASPLEVDSKRWNFATLVFVYNGFGHARNKDGLSIFEGACFMNHACQPSTVCRHSIQDDSIAVYANRYLPPGAELTFDYLGQSKLSGQDRREALWNWNFACPCELCAVPEP